MKRQEAIFRLIALFVCQVFVFSSTLVYFPAISNAQQSDAIRNDELVPPLVCGRGKAQEGRRAAVAYALNGLKPLPALEVINNRANIVAESDIKSLIMASNLFSDEHQAYLNELKTATPRDSLEDVLLSSILLFNNGFIGKKIDLADIKGKFSSPANTIARRIIVRVVKRGVLPEQMARYYDEGSNDVIICIDEEYYTVLKRLFNESAYPDLHLRLSNIFEGTQEDLTVRNLFLYLFLERLIHELTHLYEEAPQDKLFDEARVLREIDYPLYLKLVYNTKLGEAIDALFEALPLREKYVITAREKFNLFRSLADSHADEESVLAELTDFAMKHMHPASLGQAFAATAMPPGTELTQAQTLAYFAQLDESFLTKKWKVKSNSGEWVERRDAYADVEAGRAVWVIPKDGATAGYLLYEAGRASLGDVSPAAVHSAAGVRVESSRYRTFTGADGDIYNQVATVSDVISAIRDMRGDLIRSRTEISWEGFEWQTQDGRFAQVRLTVGFTEADWNTALNVLEQELTKYPPTTNWEIYWNHSPSTISVTVFPVAKAIKTYAGGITNVDAVTLNDRKIEGIRELFATLSRDMAKLVINGKEYTAGSYNNSILNLTSEGESWMIMIADNGMVVLSRGSTRYGEDMQLIALASNASLKDALHSLINNISWVQSDEMRQVLVDRFLDLIKPVTIANPNQNREVNLPVLSLLIELIAAEESAIIFVVNKIMTLSGNTRENLKLTYLLLRQERAIEEDSYPMRLIWSAMNNTKAWRQFLKSVDNDVQRGAALTKRQRQVFEFARDGVRGFASTVIQGKDLKAVPADKSIDVTVMSDEERAAMMSPRAPKHPYTPIVAQCIPCVLLGGAGSRYQNALKKEGDFAEELAAKLEGFWRGMSRFLFKFKGALPVGNIPILALQIGRGDTAARTLVSMAADNNDKDARAFAESVLRASGVQNPQIELFVQPIAPKRIPTEEAFRSFVEKEKLIEKGKMTSQEVEAMAAFCRDHAGEIAFSIDGDPIFGPENHWDFIKFLMGEGIFLNLFETAMVDGQLKDVIIRPANQDDLGPTVGDNRPAQIAYNALIDELQGEGGLYSLLDEIDRMDNAQWEAYRKTPGFRAKFHKVIAAIIEGGLTPTYSTTAGGICNMANADGTETTIVAERANLVGETPATNITNSNTIQESLLALALMCGLRPKDIVEMIETKKRMGSLSAAQKARLMQRVQDVEVEYDIPVRQQVRIADGVPTQGAERDIHGVLGRAFDMKLLLGWSMQTYEYEMRKKDVQLLKGEISYDEHQVAEMLLARDITFVPNKEFDQYRKGRRAGRAIAKFVGRSDTPPVRSPEVILGSLEERNPAAFLAALQEEGYYITADDLPIITAFIERVATVSTAPGEAGPQVGEVVKGDEDPPGKVVVIPATSEKILIQKLERLSRVSGGILVGVGLPDVHGRVFTPDDRFFTPEGEFTPELQAFMDSLSDKSVQEMIEAGIMYYDIRSKFWKENPAFAVAFAFAFAKKLQEKTGRKDGIILNIGVDGYHKHFEIAQVFADAILRTGICDHGGGINYWGVINGGDIRNYCQLYDAINKEGGHWVYFTMSHRPEDFLGAKLGITAKVYCGSEVRHCEGVTRRTLYDAIVERDFAEIKHNTPTGDIVTVSNFLGNNIQVAADMIKATSADSKIPMNELLKGTKLYVDMGGSPIGKNLVDILKALGADVLVGNEQLDADYSTKNIIDPNEHHSEPIQRLRKIAKETNRVVLAVDPDGDRGSIVAICPDGEVISMTGSELLLLTIENLAHSYKTKGITPTVICDMRTGVSAKDLARELNDRGLPVRVVPHEAGYPFFMKGMASLPADVAVENTTHAFTNPMTNPNWGSPVNYPGYQGGDNAALYLIYLLGCMVHQWEGRNPAEQLAWIRKTYNLRDTVVDERKPALPPEQDKFKYMIAERMKELAKQWFTDTSKFLINFGDPNVTVVSGVHITNVKTGAMMLVRFSNTGSSFTISGEGYTKAELNEMLGLGYLLMTTAVEQLHTEGHQFDFNPKDAANLEGLLKLPILDPNRAIYDTLAAATEKIVATQERPDLSLLEAFTVSASDEGVVVKVGDKFQTTIAIPTDDLRVSPFLRSPVIIEMLLRGLIIKRLVSLGAISLEGAEVWDRLYQIVDNVKSDLAVGGRERFRSLVEQLTNRRQLEEAVDVELGKLRDLSKVKRAVWCGMGGSGVAGDVLKGMTEELGVSDDVQVIVVKEFEIPQYILDEDDGQNTLYILSSFSGTTEETLEMGQMLQGRGRANVITMCSGQVADSPIGKLAGDNSWPFISIVEKGQLNQPREAYVLTVAKVRRILERILETKGLATDRIAMGPVLDKISTDWDKFEAESRRIATEIYNSGKMPVLIVDSSMLSMAIATRIKQQFAECPFMPVLVLTAEEAQFVNWSAYSDKFYFCSLSHKPLSGLPQMGADLYGKIAKLLDKTKEDLTITDMVYGVETLFGALAVYNISVLRGVEPMIVPLITGDGKTVMPYYKARATNAVTDFDAAYKGGKFEVADDSRVLQLAQEGKIINIITTAEQFGIAKALQSKLSEQGRAAIISVIPEANHNENNFWPRYWGYGTTADDMVYVLVDEGLSAPEWWKRTAIYFLHPSGAMLYRPHIEENMKLAQKSDSHLTYDYQAEQEQIAAISSGKKVIILQPHVLGEALYFKVYLDSLIANTQGKFTVIIDGSLIQNMDGFLKLTGLSPKGEGYQIVTNVKTMGALIKQALTATEVEEYGNIVVVGEWGYLRRWQPYKVLKLQVDSTEEGAANLGILPAAVSIAL
ncbi:MAG: hypothetical protein FJZ16_00685, partial [Candidatus Omnitrophica bacterium]|nr:hypothetical protein [Candidatus Omnitrophota bacterium]